MKYRVQCPDNHFAFFNLTSLEIEEPICEDRNFPQPRCVNILISQNVISINYVIVTTDS